MSTGRDAELSALLDGALAPEQERALRAELARSAALRERLAALAAVDAELRELSARPLPPGLHTRLRARLEAERGATAGRRMRRRATWLAGFAAAAAAAALAWYVLPGGLAAPPLASRGEGGAPGPSTPGAPEAAEEQMTQALEALAYGVPAEDRAVIGVLDELVALDELEGGGRG